MPRMVLTRFGAAGAGAVIATACLWLPAAAAAAAPSVTSLSSSSGRLTGGARITVNGAHFVRGAKVNFGTVASRSVTVSSSTRLSVVVPAHAAGTVNVRVATSAGTSAIRTNDRYRYVTAPVVSGVAPNADLPSGGRAVTIRGANFTTTTTVSFGTTRATARYVSPTQMTVSAPAHASGVVDVRATNPYGQSAAVTADRFTYRSAPDPVTDIRLADVTTTTATLRWSPSSTTDVAGVVIRRATGTVAPATPAAGEAVATVPAGTTVVTDSGLTKESVYSYALFAYTRVGPLYATPATTSVTTPTNSRPDVPIRLTTNPVPRDAAVGCTSATPCTIGSLSGEPLTLAADLSDPDASTVVTARFRLRDATEGRDLLADGDPAGVSSPVPGTGGTAVVRVASSSFVDGHAYAMDVTASDGTSDSATSGAYWFRFDAGAPSVAVTSSDTAWRVNVAGHVHFAASDVVPAEGMPSGIDHFAYATGSSSVLAGDGGIHVAPVVNGTDAAADVTLTPTAWGTNYLYVIAVDRAGNRSDTYTFSFYAAG